MLAWYQVEVKRNVESIGAVVVASGAVRSSARRFAKCTVDLLRRVARNPHSFVLLVHVTHGIAPIRLASPIDTVDSPISRECGWDSCAGSNVNVNVKETRTRTRGLVLRWVNCSIHRTVWNNFMLMHVKFARLGNLAVLHKFARWKDTRVEEEEGREDRRASIFGRDFKTTTLHMYRVPGTGSESTRTCRDGREIGSWIKRTL